MLNELFQDKVQVAIGRLQEYQELTEGEPYYLAFSGGKDSCVIKALAEMSGVSFEAHYSATGIDPPDVVRFIRKHHPDVIFDKPEGKPFLQKMATRGFPMRQRRWCCKYLKEGHGIGRVVITGIRWAESRARKQNRKLLGCNTEKMFLHPIIDWYEEDVWEFLRRYKVKYCKLYDEGWKLSYYLLPFYPPCD